MLIEKGETQAVVLQPAVASPRTSCLSHLLGLVV